MSDLTKDLAPIAHQRARDHHQNLTLPHQRFGLISKQLIDGEMRYTIYVDGPQEHCVLVAKTIHAHAQAQNEEPIDFFVAPIFEMPQ